MNAGLGGRSSEDLLRRRTFETGGPESAVCATASSPDGPIPTMHLWLARVRLHRPATCRVGLCRSRSTDLCRAADAAPSRSRWR